MKKNKIILSILVSIFTLVFITSCNKKLEIANIEIIENPIFNYQAGDNIDEFNFKGGKIKVTFMDSTFEVKDINDAWFNTINFLNNFVVINYEESTVNYEYSGVKYINSNEDLINSQTGNDTVYIISAGNYEVDYLHYTKDVILIGRGSVNITLTGQASGQAGAIFEGNTSIKNVNFETTYETSNINCVKFGKIGTSEDVPLTERLYIADSTFKGGKGINIMGLTNATLNNIYVDIENTTSSVALALSSGSNVVLKNSKITKGTWGSIAIFGVDSESLKVWYNRKSTLTVENTNITGKVYIEHYNVNNSTITGLDNYEMTEANNYRVYEIK